MIRHFDARERNAMSLDPVVRRLDALCAHVWMVRAFIKHSEEAEEDQELNEVQRELYDYLHALGPALQAGDTAEYFKLAKKKFAKLKKATEQFAKLQPLISTHTNFLMARHSLETAVAEIGQLLAGLAAK